MPWWDLRCRECGCNYPKLGVFQNAQKRDEFLSTYTCECGLTGSVEVLPSAANFSLKGKGFHCNDYPKRGGK